MSTIQVAKKKTVADFKKMKENGEKVAWVTSYVYPEAYCAEQAGIDMILVGDSGYMTVHGNQSTHGATMEDQISMTRAVRKGAPNTFIVFDMPLGSYEASEEQAVTNAIRAIKETGADAIKLEQATERILKHVTAIVESGITVFGHLGLTPQSADSYRVQGNTLSKMMFIMNQVDLLEGAGASFILLEAMPEDSAEYAARQAGIPVYGIGAGAKLDGQLLIISDLLGWYPNFKPRFAKNYVKGQVGEGFIELATNAIRSYVAEVKSGVFPSAEFIYPLKDQELIKFLSESKGGLSTAGIF